MQAAEKACGRCTPEGTEEELSCKPISVICFKIVFITPRCLFSVTIVTLLTDHPNLSHSFHQESHC